MPQRRVAGSAFAVLGAEPIGNTPSEFAALVRDEGERMGGLVKRFPIE